jgi:hypothetical protein
MVRAVRCMSQAQPEYLYTLNHIYYVDLALYMLMLFHIPNVLNVIIANIYSCYGLLVEKVRMMDRITGMTPFSGK